MSGQRVIPDPTEVVPGQLTLTGVDSRALAVELQPERPKWEPYRGTADCSICSEDQSLAVANGDAANDRRRARWTRRIGARTPQLFCGDHAVEPMTRDLNRIV